MALPSLERLSLTLPHLKVEKHFEYNHHCTENKTGSEATWVVWSHMSRNSRAKPTRLPGRLPGSLLDCPAVKPPSLATGAQGVARPSNPVPSSPQGALWEQLFFGYLFTLTYYYSCSVIPLIKLLILFLQFSLTSVRKVVALGSGGGIPHSDICLLHPWQSQCEICIY